eukprot:7856617-Karenia_brevis.AAC.1
MEAQADARRALRLIADGDISRALKLLSSRGLADASDERIVDQLPAKHPHRKEDVPLALGGRAPAKRLQLDLRETLRRLDP